MKILVTGAAGFIGSHLCERLAEEGETVVGLDSYTDYYDVDRKRRHAEMLAQRGIEVIEGDINEVDLDSLLQGIDAVVHLAGQPGVRASWGSEFDHYVRANVQATQRLLEAAKGHDLRKFVQASSSSVYGDAESFPTPETALPRPVSPYGVTKLAAEHLGVLYHKAFGVPTVGLRYFTIFGPRQRPDMAFSRFIDAARAGRPIPVYGDGEQVRDFTYVSDCVAATIAAVRRGRPGGVYNIAGGTQASVNDVLGLLEELLGREVKRDEQPAMTGDARRTGADTSLAREELGYRPEVDLRRGLELQIAG